MPEPIKCKALKSGTVVYHVADPRQQGIVRSLCLYQARGDKQHKFYANVMWIEAGHAADRVPISDLRRVTADTPSQLYRARRSSKPERAAFSSDPSRRITYGHHDGPCVFTHDEAWWFYNGTWREMSVTEAVCRAGVLTEEHFRRVYGSLPPLPPAAFRSGWSSPLV